MKPIYLQLQTKESFFNLLNILFRCNYQFSIIGKPIQTHYSNINLINLHILSKNFHFWQKSPKIPKNSPFFTIFRILRRRVNFTSLNALPILATLAIPLTFGPEASSPLGKINWNWIIAMTSIVNHPFKYSFAIVFL